MKEELKKEVARKLTSRKLWTALASFVSMMVVALGGTTNTASQATALVMAGASVIAYVLGEGLADAAHKPIGMTPHPVGTIQLEVPVKEPAQEGGDPS